MKQCPRCGTETDQPVHTCVKRQYFDPRMEALVEAARKLRTGISVHNDRLSAENKHLRIEGSVVDEFYEALHATQQPLTEIAGRDREWWRTQATYADKNRRVRNGAASMFETASKISNLLADKTEEGK